MNWRQGHVRDPPVYQHFGLVYITCEQLVVMVHVQGVSYIGTRTISIFVYIQFTKYFKDSVVLDTKDQNKDEW